MNEQQLTHERIAMEPEPELLCMVSSAISRYNFIIMAPIHVILTCYQQARVAGWQGSRNRQQQQQQHRKTGSVHPIDGIY
jgi:hypothetical protein